ncbi:hypothetical protein N9M16_02185 [Candidatus Dependentiae bacterium]|nr:hypothetical protein [Candidatus Dependentiae bacterium]
MCQYGNEKSLCDPDAKTKAASSSSNGLSGSHRVMNRLVSSGTCTGQGGYAQTVSAWVELGK